MTIREATAADHQQIAHICLLTGALGGDATGIFSNDATLADVYATPYLYGPSGFALVKEVDGQARGYIVGAVDTAAFQAWFVEEWWPLRAPRHPQRTTADEWLLKSAADPTRMLIPQLDEYPAHLHIDLLPDQQGKGAGRQLIEAGVEVARVSAPGIHLVAEKANAGAQAFYPRVGFAVIDDGESAVTWGRRLIV